MSKSENCGMAQDGDKKTFQPGLLTGIGNFWLQVRTYLFLGVLCNCMGRFLRFFSISLLM